MYTKLFTIRVKIFTLCAHSFCNFFTQKVNSKMDLLSGKMFTPNAVSTLRRFIGWRQITQSIICEWDDGNSSLKLIRKQTKILRFSFGVLLGSIYSIYLVLRLVTLLSSSSHFSIVDVLWTFLWGLYYLWAVGNYINTVLKQKDAVFFFMGMIHLDRHFEGMCIYKYTINA